MVATHGDMLASPPRRFAGVRTLVGLQLFAVGAYLLTAIAPYLLYYGIPGRPLGAPHAQYHAIEVMGRGGLANPLVWVFMIGSFVTLLVAPVAVVLSFSGVGVLARGGRLAPRVRAWLTVGTALSVLLLSFQLTPLGQSLALWIAE